MIGVAYLASTPARHPHDEVGFTDTKKGLQSEGAIGPSAHGSSLGSETVCGSESEPGRGVNFVELGLGEVQGQAYLVVEVVLCLDPGLAERCDRTVRLGV